MSFEVTGDECHFCGLPFVHAWHETREYERALIGKMEAQEWGACAHCHDLIVQQLVSTLVIVVTKAMMKEWECPTRDALFVASHYVRDFFDERTGQWRYAAPVYGV